MNRLSFNERSKWIFLIGLLAIGVGFTAKNVISYPAECIPGQNDDLGISEVSLIPKNFEKKT